MGVEIMKWLNKLFKNKNKELYSSALEMIEGTNLTSLRKKNKNIISG